MQCSAGRCIINNVSNVGNVSHCLHHTFQTSKMPPIQQYTRTFNKWCWLRYEPETNGWDAFMDFFFAFLGLGGLQWLSLSFLGLGGLPILSLSFLGLGCLKVPSLSFLGLWGLPRLSLSFLGLGCSLVSESKFGDPMNTAVGKRQAAAVGRFSLNLRLPMWLYIWSVVTVLALKDILQTKPVCTISKCSVFTYFLVTLLTLDN